MHVGASRIRSAGRTSGSIEITLPPALQSFIGINCRIQVRDGVQPEIVLQPDFAGERALTEALWRKLGAALGLGDAAEGFAPSTFVHTLLPLRHWQHGLPIAYADVMSLKRSGEERTAADDEALARLLAVLATAMGRSLGLEPSFAAAFGDAVAFVVTHVTAGFGSDFERSMAAGVSRQMRRGPCPSTSPLDDSFWSECEPALRRIREQFRTWQDDPAAFAATRQQWYRALQCEGVPGRPGARAPSRLV